MTAQEWNPTEEDREWIDAEADRLFRESERQRGGVRGQIIRPHDFRDYFVVNATLAWVKQNPIPLSEAAALCPEVGEMVEAFRKIAGRKDYADDPWDIARSILAKLEGKT